MLVFEDQGDGNIRRLDTCPELDIGIFLSHFVLVEEDTVAVEKMFLIEAMQCYFPTFYVSHCSDSSSVRI